MKIVCSQAEMLKSITIASRAIPTRTTLDILECLLIDAHDGTITITGNDLQLCIITKALGDIVEEGNVCVNSKIFTDIIRKLPEGDICIECDGAQNVRIEGMKAKFNIAGRETREYPAAPVVNEEKAFEISNFDLKEIIRKTIFSITDNDANKLMAGEHFEIDGRKLTVTALDGHRMAIVTQNLDNDYGKFDAVVIGKTLSEIAKIYSAEKEDESEKTRISLSDKQIKFVSSQTTIISRTVEGKFFNISNMLAGDYDTVLKINKKDFLDSIERASLLIRETDRRPVVIGIGEESIELKITTTLGSMNEIVPVEMEGNEFLIGFNPKFIIEALRVIDDEIIEVKLVNSKAPMKIENDEGTYKYLILPVNIGV
ncbi:MAG: DNA polymerase III subunit beta [Lachnospiraceae bacterium]|nr:DNA polymerase III subunit beta [Lachnospiraceae bacterium]